MELDQNVIQIAVVAFIALAVGGALFAVLFPYFSGDAQVNKRVATVASKGSVSRSGGIRAFMQEDKKDGRRKQIQDTLKQFEEREKQRKKRVTLRLLIAQAGLDITVKAFWMASTALGIVTAAVLFLIGGVPLPIAGIAGLVGALGLPRWFLGFLCKRRQNVFVNDFADAIDVMVRGLKAGLPVTDAMKVIASETPPPVGPEFTEVVEGQRIGITIDQGLERMHERMPIAEVNFLAIVMAIQAKTGGNLAEALNNLSKVLRDRKKMTQKIKAVSQEAKASATIIGSLPFVIGGGMTILNPEYLMPLWETETGHLMLAGSGLWMGIGCLVMRKMINFNF